MLGGSFVDTAFNLASDCFFVGNGSNLNVFNDTVDLRRILGSYHNLTFPRRVILGITQSAIHNAVPFGICYKAFHILVFHGEYGKLLAAFEHRGQTLLALDFVLISVFEGGI